MKTLDDKLNELPAHRRARIERMADKELKEMRKVVRRKVTDKNKGIRDNPPPISDDIDALVNKWNKSAAKKRYKKRFKRGQK